MNSPEIICIAEPMLEVQKFPKRFFNNLDFEADFIHNDRQDKVPNLWVVWRRSMPKLQGVSCSDQHITLRVQWQSNIFIVSFIHANCFRAARRDLWSNLAASNPGQGTPWLVTGDFNATLHAHEKRGPGSFNLGSAADFGALVDSCSLIQIPSQGRKYTWTNNRRRGNVVAVLDRSFCTDAWISEFQDCHQKVLSNCASDHSPLLVVSEASVKPSNCPFRFQRSWIDHENFLKIVKESWDEWISRSALYIFSQKIKRLKIVIKEWARETFPNVNLEKEEALKGLEEIQKEIEEIGMNDQNFAREADAKTRYLKAMEGYEKFWAEKARIRWRTQGDRSSKFFHMAVKVRRMKNNIRNLKTDSGQIITEKMQMEGFTKSYYENLKKKSATIDHMEMLDCIPKVLTDIDRWRMDAMPSNDEIKRAVWDLDLESSPGPDGFPGMFYKSCWVIISNDICNAIRGFFSKSRMPYGLNSNFLVLIPKIEGANALDKFSPLCMGNFFCKIVSKIMALRLSEVMPRLISEEQGAFQKGKIIHSNITLASELSNMMFSATRGGGMGVKIDIQKAYDTIDWDFIFHVLRKFGFSETWIRWVSVIFNGG
ncbi:uncharacterized protein LOC122065293 [Macadamia integrifolia]|uniref:uncharacterized protein LOC122065293 n=1 Tax=Macadamia integrifolia TaxID=60698 RepID=UPI001C4ED83D|nr:uncharacterized protein LOC122065293 [Macadamia integrifolia]